MTLNEKLNAMFEPVFAKMGYDIVRIMVSGGEKRKTLQVMAERRDGAPMTVDDCADLSRAISPILDEEDPIKGNYSLEVSSPGVDRPLVKPADYERFKGFEAKIETSVLLNGRKRFSGRLRGTEGDTVIMDFGGEEVRIPFSDIAKAKLILTDELIEAFAPSSDE